MLTVTKARRVIPRSGGQWDLDEAVTHALAPTGETKCGLIPQGEIKGWFQWWARPHADCKNCLRVIEREQLEG